MRRSLVAVLAAAAAALAGAVAVPASASALPTTPLTDVARHVAVDTGEPGTARETIAAAYQAAYPDLSEEAARAAAAAQVHAEEVKARVLAHPETFGGGWFDPYTATFHVAVTTAAAESQAAKLGTALGARVETHRVERTFEELWELAEELRYGDSPLARAANQQVGIDVRANRVVVALPAAELSAFQREAPTGLAREVPTGVTLVPDPDQPYQLDVCTSRQNCDDSLRAGVRVRSSMTACSAGFTARSDGLRVLTSAGHCPGQWWRTTNAQPQGYIGARMRAQNSGPVDALLIAVDNDIHQNDTVGRIYAHNASGRWVPVNGAVYSISSIWEGDTVCLSARVADPTGGNPCGTVSQPIDVFRRGMARVDGYDACPGDSGGGWYRLTPGGQRIAFGLHSRSVEGCNASPHRSWFSQLPAFATNWNLFWETG